MAWRHLLLSRGRVVHLIEGYPLSDRQVQRVVCPGKPIVHHGLLKPSPQPADSTNWVGK
jgi:hypothetical protein